MKIMETIKAPFVAAKEAVKTKIEEKQTEDQQSAKLQKWKEKLSEAISEYESYRAECATHDALYIGTKAVRAPGDSNLYMSSRFDNLLDDVTTQDTADARQVVNIIFQLIESQIDPNTPLPAVEPTEEQDDGDRKDMVEGQLSYMASDLSMRRMNSENERITKKNSMAIFKVGYDPEYSKRHTSKGRIETTNPHPMNVIPQPGVFRVKDMDYLFHIENRSVSQVCRQYGDEWRDKLDGESLEYDWLDSFSTDTKRSAGNKKGRVSVVECWYKDDDGDICLMTWVNDQIIRDEAKFFYRRDEAGKPIYNDTLEIDGREIQVPCRVPDTFPFVIWYNIPREKSYTGLADPAIIFDQQEGIKKVLSIEEQKQVRGTTKIFVRKGSTAANKITDATLQVIETEDPINDVVTKDLKTPDRGLKDLYGIYLQAAKDALGITEASQGRAENANLSGRALEQLASQTAGRMAVKAEEKDIAYTELYRLWYDFLLAYSDTPLPYRVTGDDGTFKFGYFDKAKLVRQDKAGEWYYPEFDHGVQAETGMPKDKRFVLDLANNAGQRIDNIEYWTLMESIGVPSATTILDMERKKLEAPPPTPAPGQPSGQMPGMEQPPPLQPSGMQGGQMQGQMDPLQLIQQLPPEQQAQMMQLLQTNPQQAMQLLQEIMGGGGAVG